MIELLIGGVLLAGLAGVLLFDDDGASGPAENDQLVASGDDEVFGTDGDETGFASDTSILFGGGGDDTLTAIDSSQVFGGEGDDKITGRDSSIVSGGAGDDTFNLSSAPEAYGGAGNDFFNATFAKDAEIFGGAGDDTVRYTASPLDDAQTGVLTGGDGEDTFQFDKVSGRADYAIDQIATITDFDPSEDVLSFEYGSINDLRELDPSSLILEENAEQNYVDVQIPFSDPNNELLLVRLEGISTLDPSNITFIDNRGDETLQLINETGRNGSFSLDEDGILLVGDGNDSVNVDTENWIVDLGDGNDSASIENGAGTLFGGDGRDVVTVDAGDDSNVTISGGVGADEIHVESGNASIMTGNDDDVVTTSAASGDVTIDLGLGNDEATIHQGQTVNYSIGSVDDTDGHTINLNVLDDTLDREPAKIVGQFEFDPTIETNTNVILNIEDEVDGDIDYGVERGSFLISAGGEDVQINTRVLTVKVGDVVVLEYTQILGGDYFAPDESLVVDSFNLTVVR